MPCEFLVYAADAGDDDTEYKKGDIVAIRNLGAFDPKLGDYPDIWGVKEGPPNFVIIRCDDSERIDFVQYVEERIEGFLNWELINSNASGRRYRIWISALVAAVSDRVGIKTRLRNRLERKYGATIVSANPPFEATVDIPDTDWAALREDIMSKFEKLAARRRYKFAGGDVDLVRDLGGRVTRSQAKILAVLVDKLA